MDFDSLQMIIIICFCYTADIFFTGLYMYRLNKIDPNAINREINFHRHFMHRFGIVKGISISYLIGLIFLIATCYWVSTLYSDFLLLFLGISLVPAYTNLQANLNFNRINGVGN